MTIHNQNLPTRKVLWFTCCPGFCLTPKLIVFLPPLFGLKVRPREQEQVKKKFWRSRRVSVSCRCNFSLKTFSTFCATWWTKVRELVVPFFKANIPCMLYKYKEHRNGLWNWSFLFQRVEQTSNVFWVCNKNQKFFFHIKVVCQWLTVNLRRIYTERMMFSSSAFDLWLFLLDGFDATSTCESLSYDDGKWSFSATVVWSLKPIVSCQYILKMPYYMPKPPEPFFDNSEGGFLTFWWVPNSSVCWMYLEMLVLKTCEHAGNFLHTKISEVTVKHFLTGLLLNMEYIPGGHYQWNGHHPNTIYLWL